jgi:hypothetical protein
MTEFVKREFLRLIDLLPQTDPRTNEYLTLLHSIECFDSIANSVDEMDGLRRIDLMEDRIEERKPFEEQPKKIVKIAKTPIPEEDGGKVVPFTAPDFPEPVAEEETAPPKPPEEEKIDPSEVRKALVAARARGIDSKEILSGFGVTHFQELPASKYRALLDSLEVI